MIALHAAFYKHRFLLWSEPAPDQRAFLATVEATLPEVHQPRQALEEAVIWQPSQEGKPLPSTALLDDAPPSAEECYLAPAIISVLPLGAQQAIHLLATAIGKRMLGPGVLIGADLAYWCAAMRFAAGLVTRGQFLPGIQIENGTYRARWVPACGGADAAAMQTLASAMPPAARAVTKEASDDPPSLAAGEALGDFVAFMVDGLTRATAETNASRRAESVHEQWLRALGSEHGTMKAPEAESKALAGQVAQWQRPIQVASRSPFRLCFRLEEPEEGRAVWKVRYFLQGTRDPSLLLPAGDVWQAKAGDLAALKENAAAIRENLLVSLGQAAGICAGVEASLRARAPDGFTLNVEGAHEFLRETAPALEQGGFGVMLPGWWSRQGARARLKAQAHARTPAVAPPGGLSLDVLVEFDWRLALGDEAVSPEEVEALARLKSPLVKLRGQWVEVDAREIQAALDFLKRNPSGKAQARELVRMAIGAVETAGPLEIAGVTATGWLGDVLAQLNSRDSFEQLPPPKMNATLRPYQLRGYSWLAFLKRLGLGACLADDMGLGKTIQTLALVELDRELGEKRPVLLVCPTSVVGNWEKEAARFTPGMKVMVHHGGGRKRGQEFRAEAARHAMVVSSYALLLRDEEMLRGMDWAGLILDEAQNVKNAETKQARAARGIQSGYRIALTGTPVENNVGDLWSLMEFLNEGLLGTHAEFKRKFFVPIQVYSNREVSGRLKRITGPFILRRLKTDKSVISDLPDKLEMKVYCNLTPEQATLYEAVVKNAEEAIESASGIERKGLVLATLTKLKQVCNHPAQFLKDKSKAEGRSGKLARLEEMVEETLEAGDRSLIFSQFTEMGAIIQSYLQERFGEEVLYLHGGTSKKQRDAMVERFAGEHGPRLFLLSLKAGGTGLNLTGANHVFHFDRWWNPAVENQATDRAFRIGQTKNVQVHKFICVGTLEEKIDEMIERKKEVAGQVVGAGEAWLSELSNAQLKELFALRTSAVGE